MKLWQPVAALLCCAMFSGCVPMQTNVENLMQPPKLTDLQYQVDTALRDAVGKDFSLKYPRNGTHKSAFNFIDLSGDGRDEAIAFFSTTEEYLQLAVLTQTDNGWSVADILPGIGFYSEVDFVSFEQVGGSPMLMVGWGGTGLENNIMALYNYTPQDSGQAVLQLDSRWNYSRMTLTDIDQSGTNEILLLVSADSYEPSSPTAQLIGKSTYGIIDLLAEANLPRNITTFYPPVMGGIGNDRYGATVDCVLSNGELCTITLAFDGETLLLPLNNTEQNLFQQTMRTQYVLSDDVNGDATVDIPLERLAKGYNEGSTDSIHFTEYSNIQEDLLASVQTAYINRARGYRLLFPDSWTGQPISAQLTPDGSEIVFFLAETDNLYDHSGELLKIKVYSTQDGQDMLDSERYFQLAAKGTYLYCAALPDSPPEGLGLTRQEVRKLFSLLTN